MSLAASVGHGIEQIRQSLPDCKIDVDPDRSGGASVVVSGLTLGRPYAQPDTWIGFLLTFQYPYTDVYPHFTRPDLSRLDKRTLGEGFGTAEFRGAQAIQLSRRSNKWNAASDTAILKLLKVYRWLLVQ